jgi:undecaprenyl pyrophosphate synthase
MREIEGRSHKDSSSVFLDEIVTFLHDKGVKNIILIDLSCSSFDDEYNEIDDRTVRLLQRELLSKGLHGGKKKTRRVRKTGKKKRTKTKGKKIKGKKTRRNNK